MKNLIAKLLTNPKLKQTDYNFEIDQWHGAVCFLIVEDSLFLINREESMPTHKGQISFVGGHKTSSDKTPIDTALREFEEETGLDRSCVDVLKIMDPQNTLNKFIVPVICRCRLSKSEFLKRVKSNGEWNEGICYPFEDLARSEYWISGQINTNALNYKVSFFRLERSKIRATGKLGQGDYTLWGASARMILKFLEF